MVEDAERLAYLSIIDKLIQLINPEKFVELERLQVDKSLAMLQQLEMYKRQQQKLDIDNKMAEKMMSDIVKAKEELSK